MELIGFRFIAVNLLRKADVECACCKTPIEMSYVRDLSTGLVYHGKWCYDSHILDTTHLIEGHYDVG